MENPSTIYQRICEVMKQVDAIGKDKKNDQQNYKFRGIDDVYNDIHPLFAAAGIFSASKIVAERSEERQSKNGGCLIYRILHIAYTFYGPSGDSVRTEVIGEGMDGGDKASNKAMSVAHKYAIMQLLSIPTEDAKDPENDNHEPLPKQPAPTPPPKASPNAGKPAKEAGKPEKAPEAAPLPPAASGKPRLTVPQVSAMCAKPSQNCTYAQLVSWIKATWQVKGLTPAEVIAEHSDEIRLYLDGLHSDV
jgi:hypothetical protein